MRPVCRVLSVGYLGLTRLLVESLIAEVISGGFRVLDSEVWSLGHENCTSELQSSRIESLVENLGTVTLAS
jgi:hypothetical protein